MKKNLSKLAFEMQKGEITDHIIYYKLSNQASKRNKSLLLKMSQDESRHYNFWKKFTKKDAKPNRIKIWWYTFLAHYLGLTFALRLLESGEQNSQDKYSKFKNIKGVSKIIKEEHNHEQKVVSLLKDERLEYTGSVVLGLNDALVELTGALAGMTFAIRNNKIVAIAGLITGLAAALSMASSSYFSMREDSHKRRDPIKSAIYTGLTYLVVVLLLVAPYFILSNLYFSLITTFVIAILIVAAYTYYISTARETSFKKNFLEMALVSFSTAFISFLFGLLLNHWFGI